MVDKKLSQVIDLFHLVKETQLVLWHNGVVQFEWKGFGWNENYTFYYIIFKHNYLLYGSKLSQIMKKHKNL